MSSYLRSNVEPCEVFDDPASPNAERYFFSEQDTPNGKSPNQEDWDERNERVETNLSDQWEGKFHPSALILKIFRQHQFMHLLRLQLQL